MPCACRMCSQSEDPHYYDYNKLKERMIIKGDKKIECPISYEDISVTKITGFSESISKYEIYDLVSINKLDEAFEILLSKYDNNDLRLLSSRHEDLKNQQKKGVISYDNYQLEKNQLERAESFEPLQSLL